MTDANFLSAYNEVVLENLNAILKQNFMFQTQLKILEERVGLIPKLEEQVTLYEKQLADKQKDISNLQNEVSSVKTELEYTKNDLNNKDQIIQSTVQSDGDKHRLQTALNSQAKKIEDLMLRIGSIDEVISKKDEYIKQLEDMLPNSKRKKLGLEVEEPKLKEEIVDNVAPLKVESSGGTF